MPALQGAVETAPVSRLHEKQSYDPADFPVPTGREEEWRFTPLRRLRALHADLSAGDGKVSVVADPVSGVAIEKLEHGDPRLGVAYIPGDRVSARAFGSFKEATAITFPAGTESTEPVHIAVRGRARTVRRSGTS